MGQGIVTVLNISRKLTGLLWCLVYSKSSTTPAAFLSYPSTNLIQFGNRCIIFYITLTHLLWFHNWQKKFQSCSWARIFSFVRPSGQVLVSPYLPLTGIFIEFLPSWTLVCTVTQPPCWVCHTEQGRHLCLGDGSRLQE